MSTATGTHVDVWWNMKGAENLTEVHQKMTIKKKTKSSYWSLFYGMTGASGDAGEQQGYMGLQTDATRPDGSKGEMAIFSVWNADAFRNQQGRCITFGGEGVGLSCRAAAAIDVSSTYKFRVKKLETDATGQWWGGWIDDVTAGTSLYLGDLHNRSPWLANDRLVNFSEYWGTSVPCAQVPTSAVVWAKPQANPTNATADSYQYQAGYNQTVHGDCTDTQVTPTKLDDLDAYTVFAGPAASTLLPTGQHRIQGLDSKCLGAANGSTTDGTAVDLYPCTGAPTQDWTFPGDGTVRVGEKCLDVKDRGTTDGSVVQIYTCNGTVAQQWYYEDRELVNPNADKCLDLKDNSSADYTRTQVWTCTDGGNQKWSLV
ncbi:hypothetical protein Kisp02_13280 [Kineosporia sp. NBRC 101731]|nr:hypothetical protein Kisp02_13280 [Kineosporia sp. NBRC 101731]